MFMEKTKTEILKAVTSDGLLDCDWKGILRRINNRRFLSANEYDFWECIYIITKAFQTKQCRDINVISKVLRLACIKNNTYILWSFSAEDDDGLDIYLKGNDNLINKLYYPFHSVFKWNNIDFFVEVLETGNVEFFKLLLNFGASMLTSPEEPHYYCNYVSELLLERYNLYYEFHFDIYWVDRSFYFKCEDKNRTLLVMITLEILRLLLRYRGNGAEKIVQGTRIFFDSLPIPCITSREVRMLLEGFYGAFPSEQLIDQIIEDYEHYFPESTDLYRPRSLQDLCRCRMRESLRSAKTIWYGVPLLPLPKLLKRFLLFETEDY